MLVAATAKEDIAHIASQTAEQTRVPALKVLPRRVTLEQLGAADTTDSVIPLGLGGRDLGPVGVEADHLVAIGAAGSGKSTLVETLITSISTLDRDNARMVIIDPRRAHLKHSSSSMVAAYGGSGEAARTALADAAVTLTKRLPGPDITPEQLAARNWWSGPDIYVLIDDLELVDDDALRALVPLLPHAQDIGMHILAARKFGGAGRAMLSPFLATLRDQLPDAVLLSGNRDEGPLFGSTPIPAEPGRGIFIRNNEQVGPIQIALSEAGEQQ